MIGRIIMKHVTNGVTKGWAAAMVLVAGGALSAADWPEWRGPQRDGHSTETNLPERWSPAGENLAWRAPFGGRSAPVAAGNRLCMQNTVGDVAATQERVMCLDVGTGKPIWERRFSVYLSDVPQHRAAWASPALEPFDGRRVRSGHHAWRSHRLARHRRRQGGHQRAERGVGRSGAHEQQVLRIR